MKPQVFGHRGACGYLPENTMESLLLAFEQGAEAVEFDVVPTGDGKLLVRHENNLAPTTNISELEQFAQFEREGLTEGKPVRGWFTEDLTLAQARSLLARERFPRYRPAVAEHNDRYQIIGLEELLNRAEFDGKHLILEVKHGKYFESIGLDPVPMVAAALAESNWHARGITLTVESFNFEVLQRLRDAVGKPAEFVFLTDHHRSAAVAAGLSDGNLGAHWDAVAENFDGLSVDLEMLFSPLKDNQPPGANRQFGEPNGLAQQIQARGLKIFGYTARTEMAKYSVDEYHLEIIGTGVDAIFSDQPDQLLKTVRGLA